MQPAKVLLLESVAAQAAAARNALSGAGYRLVISRFEGDGLAKIREWKPDIVVLSNAFTRSSLTDFCRRLQDGARGLRIVIASSLPLERLLADEPELRALASAFVLRPYNPAKLRQTIDRLVLGSGVNGETTTGTGKCAGKRIFLAESDEATAAAVKEHLAPLGIAVDLFDRDDVENVAGRAPDAIVIGWPVPRGLTLDVLRRLAAGGPPPPLVVLTEESQGAVKARAPALFSRTKMIFTKPVPWPHFTRFLTRLLSSPPAAAAAEAGRPVQQEGQAQLLKQIDMQAREIAELKKRLFESGGRDSIADIDRQVAAADKEKRELRARLTELEKQIEMERAKHQFKETELEVRLSSLLRKRSESEKRAQDLIDEGNERAEDMQRALAEAHGEMHLLSEEVSSLKKDYEETLIAKEHAEEELQAQRRLLEKEMKALEEEKSRVGGREQELRQSLAEARKALDAAEEHQESLRNELKGHQETSAARDGEMERLEGEIRSLEGERARLSARVGELEHKVSDRRAAEDAARAAELEKENADLHAALERSEETVKGLDEELAVWREKAAGAEASLAETAVREAQLTEQIEEKAAELEKRAGEIAALRERLEALTTAASPPTAGAAKPAAPDDGERDRFREAVAKKEADLRYLRGALSLAGESKKELARRVEELDGSLREERQNRELLEKEVAALREDGGTLPDEGEIGRLRESLAEAENERRRLADRVEELLAGAAARERERDEARSFLEEARQRAVLLEGEIEKARLEGRETAESEAVSRLEGQLADAEVRNAELQRRVEKEAFVAGEREKDFQERLRAEEEEQGTLRQRIEDLIEEAATESERFRETQAMLEQRERDAEEAGRRAEELLQQLEVTKSSLGREQEEHRSLRKRLDEKELRLQEELEKGDRLQRKLEEQTGQLQSSGLALEAEKSTVAALEEELRERRKDLKAVKAELSTAQSQDNREELERLRAQLTAAEENAEAALRESRDAERIQKMLEEVTARAQTEIIEQSRKEVELQERLRTSVEEKKFLLTRMEKELAGAAERERRLSDLLEKSLKGSAQLAESISRRIEPDTLPVAVADGSRRTSSLLPAVASGIAALVLVGVVGLAVFGLRDARRETTPAPAPEVTQPAAEERAAGEQSRGGLSAQREIWEDWSRSDVSGGVLFQATLRSPEEITAAVDAEKKLRGWSDERAATELTAQLEPYRFDENYYFHIYLKNLEPGYPSYVDNFYANLYLRDDQGREARAFLPADLEKYRRVYSFNSGELAKGRKELTYEVGIPVAFSRADLSAKPAFIELLAYNVGSSSRRVLTWELR